jgi:hypothetical protein
LISPYRRFLTYFPCYFLCTFSSPALSCHAVTQLSPSSAPPLQRGERLRAALHDGTEVIGLSDPVHQNKKHRSSYKGVAERESPIYSRNFFFRPPETPLPPPPALYGNYRSRATECPSPSKRTANLTAVLCVSHEHRTLYQNTYESMTKPTTRSTHATPPIHM